MENLMLPRTLLFELQWLKIKTVKESGERDLLAPKPQVTCLLLCRLHRHCSDALSVNGDTISPPPCVY